MQSSLHWLLDCPIVIQHDMHLALQEMRNATSSPLEDIAGAGATQNEAENAQLQLSDSGGISAPSKDTSHVGLSAAPRNLGDAVSDVMRGLAYVGSQIDPLSPAVNRTRRQAGGDPAGSGIMPLEVLANGRTHQDRVDEEVEQLQQQRTVGLGQHGETAAHATNSAEQGRVDAEASQLQTQGFDAEARGGAAGSSGAAGDAEKQQQQVLASGCTG